MRALGVPRSVAIGAAVVQLAVVTPVAAGPWHVQLEAGGEVDTNIQRVETGPMLDTSPIAAAVGRAGGRVDTSGRRGSGGYALALAFAARAAADRTVTSEDAALLGADARWLHGSGRGGTVGARVAYTDAIPLAGVTGTRTFRSFAGEALVVLRHTEGDAVTFAAGGRALTYKPDHDFDWMGPTVSARLDHALWHSADDTRTLELVADYRLERRGYAGAAFANRCAPGADPAPMCFAPTTARRSDLYHAGGVEVTYTGERVVSAAYQLVYADSNSYGQSLLRHRLILSATAELPGGFIGTATLTGQLDQYLDTLILARDVQNQSFTALDDDNRSSLQLRTAHPVSAHVSFEARAAYWTNLGGPAGVDFRRLLVYAGLVWAND